MGSRYFEVFGIVASGRGIPTDEWQVHGWTMHLDEPSIARRVAIPVQVTLSEDVPCFDASSLSADDPYDSGLTERRFYDEVQSGEVSGRPWRAIGIICDQGEWFWCADELTVAR